MPTLRKRFATGHSLFRATTVTETIVSCTAAKNPCRPTTNKESHRPPHIDKSRFPRRGGFLPCTTGSTVVPQRQTFRLWIWSDIFVFYAVYWLTTYELSDYMITNHSTYDAFCFRGMLESRFVVRQARLFRLWFLRLRLRTAVPQGVHDPASWFVAVGGISLANEPRYLNTLLIRYLIPIPKATKASLDWSILTWLSLHTSQTPVIVPYVLSVRFGCWSCSCHRPQRVWMLPLS